MRPNKNTITKPKIVNGGVASGQTNPIGGGGIGSEVAAGNSNYFSNSTHQGPTGTGSSPN
jgi:hypothetical protein